MNLRSNSQRNMMAIMLAALSLAHGGEGMPDSTKSRAVNFAPLTNREKRAAKQKPRHPHWHARNRRTANHSNDGI